jgi:hypothetical protein
VATAGKEALQQMECTAGQHADPQDIANHCSRHFSRLKAPGKDSIIRKNTVAHKPTDATTKSR